MVTRSSVSDCILCDPITNDNVAKALPTEIVLLPRVNRLEYFYHVFCDYSFKYDEAFKLCQCDYKRDIDHY